MSADFVAVAHARVTRTAAWLCRQAGWALPERADLEQHLWTYLLERQRDYDPDRASTGAFITVVLRRCAANLLRDRLALYRRTGVVYSLDQAQAGTLVGDPDLAAVVTHRENDARRRSVTAAERERRELHQDVAEVLRRLPTALRRVARALATSRTKAEAARRLGLPRSTLQAQVLQLRRCFTRAGLQEDGEGKKAHNPPAHSVSSRAARVING